MAAAEGTPPHPKVPVELLSVLSAENFTTATAVVTSAHCCEYLAACGTPVPVFVGDPHGMSWCQFFHCQHRLRRPLLLYFRDKYFGRESGSLVWTNLLLVVELC